MTFSQAIQSVFSQYTGFHGRARRSEYWYFILLYGIVTAVIGALTQILHLSRGTQSALTTIWQLAVLLPHLAVCVRRLHDIGKSGWAILFGLIPIAGTIILLVFYLRDSQPGENEYGVSEKYPNGVPFTHATGSGDYYAPYTNHSPTSHTASYQPPQYHTPHTGDGFSDDNFVQQEYDTGDSLGVTCPFCGAKNVARSRFCTSCGAPFDK